MEVWARDTAGVAVLTCGIDEIVDLFDGQALVDEVADVVCDHGAAVRAGLRVAVAIAREGAKALPAEVVAAALAWCLSVAEYIEDVWNSVETYTSCGGSHPASRC